jgi:hypothetical protein
VVRLLRAAGLTVEPHHTHFPPGTQDPEWLAATARRQWVVLTKDDRIRYSPLAKAAIMNSGARVFVLIGTRSHSDLTQNLINSLGRVRRLIAKQDGPFIARVFMASEERRRKGQGGDVKLWLDRSNWT